MGALPWLVVAVVPVHVVHQASEPATLFARDCNFLSFEGRCTLKKIKHSVKQAETMQEACRLEYEHFKGEILLPCHDGTLSQTAVCQNCSPFPRIKFGMKIKLIPAQLADAKFAVVLSNLLLCFVAQSFLLFLEILRNLRRRPILYDFDFSHLSWPAPLFLPPFCC